MTRGTRIGIFLLGAVVVLVGLFIWTMETEYSRLSFVTTEAEGEVKVWEHENWDQTNLWLDNPETLTPEALEAAGGEIVFIGTEAEADFYTTEREEESKSYLVAGLVIAAGALLIVIALISRKEEEKADETVLSVPDRFPQDRS